MHTVHHPLDGVANNGFVAAAMGIIFSVEEYTSKLSTAEQMVIDTFFDSLQWADLTTAGPTVDIATYGNLMMLFDMKNRWIYKGSVTTPPCDTNVYWNVLSTIYPISAKHMTLFKAQLARGDNGQLAVTGNYREIQKIDGQDVIYLSSEKTEEFSRLVIAIICLAISTVIGIVAALFFMMKAKKYSAVQES